MYPADSTKSAACTCSGRRHRGRRGYAGRAVFSRRAVQQVSTAHSPRPRPAHSSLTAHPAHTPAHTHPAYPAGDVGRAVFSRRAEEEIVSTAHSPRPSRPLLTHRPPRPHTPPTHTPPTHTHPPTQRAMQVVLSSVAQQFNKWVPPTDPARPAHPNSTRPHRPAPAHPPPPTPLNPPQYIHPFC